MVLHGSLTDPQIRGDVLAGMSGEHKPQNLPLTLGQTLEMRGGGHASRLLRPQLTSWLERIFNACEKLFMPEGLFDEVGGPGPHGLDGH